MIFFLYFNTLCAIYRVKRSELNEIAANKIDY